MRVLLIICLATAGSFACNFKQPPAPDTFTLTQTYFSYYQTRTDWKGFLELFAEDMKFQDVILRMDLEGRNAFANFYNWPDTALVKHPDYPNVLVLEDLTVSDSTAVGIGRFTPFYYNGILYDDAGHMRFCIQLTFNKAGLISRQVDFIEYPPEMLQQVVSGLLQHDQ